MSRLNSTVGLVIRRKNVLRTGITVRNSRIVPARVGALLGGKGLSAGTVPINQFGRLRRSCIYDYTLQMNERLFTILPSSLIVIATLSGILGDSANRVRRLPVLDITFAQSAITKLGLRAVSASSTVGGFIRGVDFGGNIKFSTITTVSTRHFRWPCCEVV